MDAKYFVPFKTAQLLKEKGYPQDKSDYGYFDNGDSHPIIMFPADNFDCAAPTYHEVVDWLEDKDIYIDVCRTDNTLLESGYRWHCYIWERDTDDWCTVTIEYPTREEAINEGILKALEML